MGSVGGLTAKSSTLRTVPHTSERRRPRTVGLIDAFAANVDVTTADFYCCRSSPTLSIDAYVRRGRSAVLAAHRLVCVSDVIARDQLVGDRIATAANEFG